MTTNPATSNKRRVLLESANQIILTSGAAHLTLDAVAREAGVSKGGLLYHFPTKEALLIGLIEHLIAEFDNAIAQEMARDAAGDTPGRWLRAYVRVTFDFEQLQLLDLSAGLLAAAAADPALLAPMRAAFDRWQQRAEQDGIDPARATIIRLATDGFWFTDLLGLTPLDQPARERLSATLLALTMEGSS